MNKKNIAVCTVLIILIVFVFLGFFKNFKEYFKQSISLASVSIITEKNEYKSGDNLKLNITNNSGKTICFSSCYPYFLERKDKEWKSCNYVGCDRANIHDGCIENNKIKAFELKLPAEVAGGSLHRIAVPVCIDCKVDDSFKESLRYHSNEFSIN